MTDDDTFDNAFDDKFNEALKDFEVSAVNMETWKNIWSDIETKTGFNTFSPTQRSRLKLAFFSGGLAMSNTVGQVLERLSEVNFGKLNEKQKADLLCKAFCAVMDALEKEIQSYLEEQGCPSDAKHTN